MKKVSRWLTLLLVFAMVFSLAACTTRSNTGSDAAKDKTTAGTKEPVDYEDKLASIIPEKTVRLNVYTQLANYSGEQIGWFAQIMKEKFNVVLNIIRESEGTFATRMESGDLGDIVVFGNDSDEYLQAINAGLLLDWEEDNLVQEYGPYIWKHMQKALEKNKKLSPDGK